jgi:hypothetical protein
MPNRFVWLIALTLLAACGPSEKQKAVLAEKKRVECLDKLCDGDVPPKYDPLQDTTLKLNGKWFIGPREYFSNELNGASFEWWEHKPLSSSARRPPEAQALALAGRGYDFSIEVFLRSDNFPLAPHGYRLIEYAETNGLIAERKTLRAGLDAIRMRHVIGPRGFYIDHVTYYVASNLVGTDGLPPVATCDNLRTDGGGGTGFLWAPGVWAGTRMNQKHCVDWPEIYLETVRILQLLRGAQI